MATGCHFGALESCVANAADSLKPATIFGGVALHRLESNRRGNNGQTVVAECGVADEPSERFLLGHAPHFDQAHQL